MLGFTLGVAHSMGLDKCFMSINMISYRAFHHPKNPLCYAYSSPLQPLAATDLLFPKFCLFQKVIQLESPCSLLISDCYSFKILSTSFHELIVHFFSMLNNSGSHSKQSVCNAGDPGLVPGTGRSPGEGNGTHSSILALEIPWTEEPGRLHPMRSQKVRHD